MSCLDRENVFLKFWFRKTSLGKKIMHIRSQKRNKEQCDHTTYALCLINTDARKLSEMSFKLSLRLKVVTLLYKNILT